MGKFKEMFKALFGDNEEIDDVSDKELAEIRAQEPTHGKLAKELEVKIDNVIYPDEEKKPKVQKNSGINLDEFEKGYKNYQDIVKKDAKKSKGREIGE